MLLYNNIFFVLKTLYYINLLFLKFLLVKAKLNYCKIFKEGKEKN